MDENVAGIQLRLNTQGRVDASTHLAYERRVEKGESNLFICTTVYLPSFSLWNENERLISLGCTVV